MSESPSNVLGDISQKLKRLQDPDASLLMEDWERIIAADNKRGILLGLDKDDHPFAPVTYRPKGKWQRKPTKRQRNLVKSGSRGIFAGLGEHPSGTNNNLTSAEYRVLGGPPLAPRGAYSRIITNLFTQHARDPGDGFKWFAEGKWVEVKSVRGVSFLPFLFKGFSKGKASVPPRDPCGVREWGRARAVEALNKWTDKFFKEFN